MSEGPEKRKELLKHMILQLHEGEAPEQVRKQLVSLLQKIPYSEVVQVEQELINEGLPEEEVLKFCDIHTMVLEGKIDLEGMKIVPEGHPVDTFNKENKALELNKLPHGKIMQLTTSFVPAPVIEKIHSKGYYYWVGKVNDNVVHTYFRTAS